MARMWNYICCPSCDFLWTFTIQPPQAGVSASGFSNGRSRPDLLGPLSPGTPAASAFEQPLNFDRLFSELDKFCSHILSLPAATNHPEIKQQLDFITTSKEKLNLAQAEELAHRKARQEQLAELVQAANQNEEAHRKRMEELKRPSPPLDGNALGHALLKSLGLGTPKLQSFGP